VATEDIYNGRNTKIARQRLPQNLWRRAQRLMDQLQQAHALGDMAQPPGNRLEKLEGGNDRYSVRINDQYRIVWIWRDGAAEEVWCGDYH
jgi:proteic killer suppression protein